MLAAEALQQEQPCNYEATFDMFVVAAVTHLKVIIWCAFLCAIMNHHTNNKTICDDEKQAASLASSLDVDAIWIAKVLKQIAVECLAQGNDAGKIDGLRAYASLL